MSLREKQGNIEEDPMNSELHKILSRANMAPVGDSIMIPEFSAASFFSDSYVLVDCSSYSHKNLPSEKPI